MYFTKSLPATLIAACLSMFGGPACWAATEATFSEPAFATSQHQGKPILVEIDASWCSTCAKQRPIIAHLANEPEFKSLIIYKVDFDTQKDIVREMGARMQSTLIVFHGNAERGRSVGDTKESSIKALLEKAGP
jgi:thioredoxin 1